MTHYDRENEYTFKWGYDRENEYTSKWALIDNFFDLDFRLHPENLRQKYEFFLGYFQPVLKAARFALRCLRNKPCSHSPFSIPAGPKFLRGVESAIPAASHIFLMLVKTYHAVVRVLRASSATLSAPFTILTKSLATSQFSFDTNIKSTAFSTVKL